MTVPLVVKFSGKCLENENDLNKIFSLLKKSKPIIIVHGGGVEVDSLLSKLSFATQKIDGIRVSPDEQMPYITGALSGTCNKKLQAMLIANGLLSQGLLCTDMQMLKASKLDEKYGNVGTTEPQDPAFIHYLIERNVIPVISSIAIDNKGRVLNVNADDVALSIAIMLKSPLVYLSDVDGVLDKKGQTIEFIDESIAHQLISDCTITDGMIVKVKSALRASSLTTKEVYIASVSSFLLQDLSSLRRLGTTVLVK